MLPPGVRANVDTVAHNYANLFNQAHKMDDTEKKDKYYKLITGNEELLEHVKKFYPATYTLIRLEKTKRRLDTMKFRLGDEPLSSGTGTDRADAGGGTSSLKSEKRTGTDNQSAVKDFPNQDRAPNRTTSGSSNSGIRTTNRDIVDAFSNQDRVRQFSNQKRMQQGR
ncbi:MAG: hypothetical protein K8F30_09505 [Taibaiella sp.]|nr:hypothetical protein [Taibaiella sp.]